MIRTILVPLDGSLFGEQALPLALSIARRAQARLELLHVHTPVLEYSELLLFDVPLDTKIREQEKLYLKDMVDRLSPETNVKVSTVIKEGHVPEVIKEHAAAMGADMIVMTTHARGPLGRFWMGSVTDRLLRETEVPMLLVHPREGGAEKPIQDIRLTNILVALDGSKFSEGILEHMLPVAQLFEASITLVRVIKPLLPMTMPMGAGSFGEMAHHMTAEVKSLQENLLKEAGSYLEKVANSLRGKGLDVQMRVEVEEQPALAILNVKGPDLIALETHGRRGLTRFFLGSVADKVLRGSTIPMLVCRPKDKK